MRDNLDLSNCSMLDLFSMEVESQGEVLNDNLLNLENQLQESQGQASASSLALLESLMRASHSIKGAARIVQLEPAVRIAHVMEDCFMAAMDRTINLQSDHIDLLLQAVDFLLAIGQVGEANINHWLGEHQGEAEQLVISIASIMGRRKSDRGSDKSPQTQRTTTTPQPPPPSPAKSQKIPKTPELLTPPPSNSNRRKTPETPEDEFFLGSTLEADEEPENSSFRDFELSLDDVFSEDTDIQLGKSKYIQDISDISEEESTGNLLTESASKLESTFDLSEEVMTWVEDDNEPISQGTSSLTSTPKDEPITSISSGGGSSKDRFVRVSAEGLNRLMGLAGESLVEATALSPMADSFITLKRSQLDLSRLLEQLQMILSQLSLGKEMDDFITDIVEKERECRTILGDRLSDLEQFAYRSFNLSDRLYREVIATHMRPFEEGVTGFPRMVRDISRKLNKRVKLEIAGRMTMVDRDILRKLEAPLTHILSNSIDHGIESPEERVKKGKPPEGHILLEASHRFGMLSINVIDDGRGIELEKLRQSIVDKGLVPAEMAKQLNEAELMEFIFLPNFSTSKTVTDISGRGVGLNIAKTMVQEVGGNLQAVSRPGEGMSFHFQLPLTLSVIRTLLVDIAGQPYAFPLSRIDQILTLNYKDIHSVENRQYFTLEGQNIGLVRADQVLNISSPASPLEPLSIVILSDQTNRYGLVVDRFIGEKSLVVRPLDSRLGKVQDISGAAILEDGSPILILDVLDLVRSLDKLLANVQVNQIKTEEEAEWKENKKHILVVDDSITVREMEKKLLQNQGYLVDVAVDGMEGWNAVRMGNYDLVISDIDMPRMNGIKLVSQIKNHPNLKSIPVIIVSYKDREEDRLQGLEAGADYYLTKSSFHDDTLINAVVDLIG